MGAVTFFAFHVVAAGTEGEDVSTAVFVGFEWLVSFGEKIKNVTLATGDFSDNVVTPDNEPNYGANKKKNYNQGSPGNDFAFFRYRFFMFFGFFGGIWGGRVFGGF